LIIFFVGGVVDYLFWKFTKKIKDDKYEKKLVETNNISEATLY
jgi:hypothetical protein